MNFLTLNDRVFDPTVTDNSSFLLYTRPSSNWSLLCEKTEGLKTEWSTRGEDIANRLRGMINIRSFVVKENLWRAREYVGTRACRPLKSLLVSGARLRVLRFLCEWPWLSGIVFFLVLVLVSTLLVPVSSRVPCCFLCSLLSLQQWEEWLRVLPSRLLTGLSLYCHPRLDFYFRSPKAKQSVRKLFFHPSCGDFFPLCCGSLCRRSLYPVPHLLNVTEFPPQEL